MLLSPASGQYIIIWLYLYSYDAVSCFWPIHDQLYNCTCTAILLSPAYGKYKTNYITIPVRTALLLFLASTWQITLLYCSILLSPASGPYLTHYIPVQLNSNLLSDPAACPCHQNNLSCHVTIVPKLLGSQRLYLLYFRLVSKPLHCKDTIPKIWNKYSQKRNCPATVQISTFMCLCELFIYFHHRSAYLLQEICGPILGI